MVLNPNIEFKTLQNTLLLLTITLLRAYMKYGHEYELQEAKQIFLYFTILEKIQCYIPKKVFTLQSYSATNQTECIGKTK